MKTKQDLKNEYAQVALEAGELYFAIEQQKAALANAWKRMTALRAKKEQLESAYRTAPEATAAASAAGESAPEA